MKGKYLLEKNGLSAQTGSSVGHFGVGLFWGLKN